MQQLHLVGFTTDLEGLIFSARRGSRSGGYMVVLDDRLVARVEEALRLREARLAEGSTAASDEREPLARRVFPEEDDLDEPDFEADADDESGDDEDEDEAPAAPFVRSGPRLRQLRPDTGRRESALSVREIQARLRAGYSIAAVADEAGVGEEWVTRFAAPILAEQQQVLDRARDLVYTAPRKGESSLPLGASVEWAVAERGVAMPDAEFERAWSAHQLRDGSWVVRFSYTSRRREQHADWQVNLRTGELTGLNRLATDLGYVGKGQRTRRAAGEPFVEAEVVAAPRPAPARRRAPRRGRPAPGRAALAKEVVAKKVVAKKAGPPPAKKAAPAPKPAVAKKARPPAKPTAAKPAAAKKARPPEKKVDQKPAKPPVQKQPAEPRPTRSTAVRVAAAGKTTPRRALAAAVKSAPPEAEVDWDRPPVVRRRPRAEQPPPTAEPEKAQVPAESPVEAKVHEPPPAPPPPPAKAKPAPKQAPPKASAPPPRSVVIRASRAGDQVPPAEKPAPQAAPPPARPRRPRPLRARPPD